MQPISDDELRGLPLNVLVERIDAFLSAVIPDGPQREFHERFDVNAAQIMGSSTVCSLDERDQRRAVMFFYRAMFQRALTRSYFGLENQTIHSIQGDEKWHHPNVQLRHGALRQAAVISGRISFECIMEFIHLVREKQTIPAKRSKSKSFRKWVSSPGNPFGWIVFYLIVLHRFDKLHRTPEVHGTSYIATDALRCANFPVLETELDVVNLEFGVWRSILSTLNHQGPGGCQFGAGDEDLFRDFFRWEELNLVDLWQRFTSGDDSE